METGRSVRGSKGEVKRCVAAEFQVLGFVHHTHSAAPEPRQDAIARKGLAKHGNESVRPRNLGRAPRPRWPNGLEGELQRELHDAVASGADYGIGGGEIRRSASTPERGAGGVAESGARRGAVGIGEGWVIKQVEQLDSELRAVAILEHEVFEQRKIPVLEARVSENVAAHRAERSELGRDHDRAAGNEAATGSQCTSVGSDRRTAAPHVSSLRGREHRLGAINTTRGTAFHRHLASHRCHTWDRRVNKTAERKRTRAGPEIVRVSNENPAIGPFPDPAEIASCDEPRLAALQGYDGVDLPPFQQLPKSFFPRKVITGPESKAVPDVEIAAGVLCPRIRTVLGLPSETIQRTVIQAMPVCVPGEEGKPVGNPLG